MANKYSSMRFSLLFFMAWRNLVHKKLRTALTVFGIVIGIGAVFFLISFGLGIQKLVTNQVVGNQSIKSIDVTSANTKIVKLDSNVQQKLKNLPHVARIGAAYSYAGNLKSSGGSAGTIVYGVDSSYLDMANLPLQSGRLLKASDDKTIVINASALSALNIKEPKKAIGRDIAITIPSLKMKTPAGDQATFNYNFKIVGVSGDKDGSEVYIPASIVAASGADQFTQIKIEADNSKNVRDIRAQIATLGLQTTSPIDTIDQINQVFQFFNVILVGFGSIGMIVAILGMFNTLTISLLERTKEIGLMFALGGRERDMRRLFQTEAALLSVIGSTLGIVLALLVGQIANLIMNLFAKHRGVMQGFQLFSVPWWLIIGSISFMFVIGLIVVFLPARHAARINPIDALRRE